MCETWKWCKNAVNSKSSQARLWGLLVLTLGHPAAVLGVRQVGSVATLSPGGKGGP